LSQEVVMVDVKFVKVQNGQVLVNNDHRTRAEREADELKKLMGITSDWEIENIKDTAMNRFNVKKGKRAAIKRILDDAFEQLRTQR